MAKEEQHLRGLEQFLPVDTFDMVSPFFKQHTIHLTLTHERKSVLGDYRAPTREKPYHRISINATLNPFSFLITLLHELAHLLTYEQYKHTVSPHGKEWKSQFQRTLLPFVGQHIFPPDVEQALQDYLNNPAASTCTDPQLYKALNRYDPQREGFKYVEDLGINQLFETEDGRKFQKLEKRRTRSKCKELTTGKMYLFPGIAQVKVV